MTASCVANRHTDDDYVRSRRDLLWPKRCLEVSAQHLMTEVGKESVERASHAAFTADDRDGLRLDVERHLGAKRGLALPAHQHQLTPDRFDAPGRKTELLGAGTAILENTAFPSEVSNPNAMRSLPNRNLRHDVHPADQQLQELMVEGVERASELQKGPFVWILVGHGLVLHRTWASA